MDQKIYCRLCKMKMSHFSHTRNRDYYRCSNCDSIQLYEEQLLDSENEKKRYDTHNNDINDLGYQKFVSPITSYILNTFKARDKGLDFGAGPGPVISKVLKDNLFQIEIYDPYYHHNKSLLENKYTYIIACEVIEHFNQPQREFDLLNSLLNDFGQWVFMTDIYDDSIDFDTWYYKNDETHVIFYTKKTFDYLKKVYNFDQLIIDKRLIILKKNNR